MTYEILDNVSIPSKEPVDRAYPFSKLLVGQCFFVPDSDFSSGDAFKVISSSVTAANSRYSTPTGRQRPSKTRPGFFVDDKVPTRLFKASRASLNGSSGCYVHRLELPVVEAQDDLPLEVPLKSKKKVDQ